MIKLILKGVQIITNNEDKVLKKILKNRDTQSNNNSNLIVTLLLHLSSRIDNVNSRIGNLEKNTGKIEYKLITWIVGTDIALAVAIMTAIHYFG